MEPRKVFTTKHGKVKLSDLITDGRFNRKISQHWVNHIVTNFKGAVFGDIKVSERKDGKFVILDGQHRVEALRQLGFPEGRQIIPAEIHTGLNDSEEAYLTKTYNDNKLFGPFEKFKAMLHAGDPDCRAINSIVEGAGLRIAQGSRDGHISAVTTLHRIYGLSKPQGVVLKDALHIVINAWGTYSDALRRDVLEGLALFLHGHPKAPQEELIKRLSLHPGGPTGLVGRGNVIRGKTPIMSISAAIAEVIDRDVMKKRRRNMKAVS